MDYEDTSKLISAHTKQLDSMLKLPQSSVSVKNINENYETFSMKQEKYETYNSKDFSQKIFFFPVIT